MALTLVSVRYNWMGYRGTESEEAALLRWAGKQQGNLDYFHRAEVLDDVEDRLLLMKMELGLLSEEEVREIQKRREEARRAEEERQALLEEARKDRLAAQRKAIEDEESAARAKLLAELAELADELHLTPSQMREALLAGLAMHTTLAKSAVVFSDAARNVLLTTGAGYYSYLDGSCHSSLDALDSYNSSTRDEMEAKGANLPDAHLFSTDHLHFLIKTKNAARIQLDAVRAKNNPEYARLLRSSERSSMENVPHVSEAKLLSDLDEALDNLKQAQNLYNTQASSTANIIIKSML